MDLDKLPGVIGRLFGNALLALLALTALGLVARPLVMLVEWVWSW